MIYLYLDDLPDDGPDYEDITLDELITLRNMAESTATDPEEPARIRRICEKAVRLLSAEIDARIAAAVQAEIEGDAA